MYKVLITGAGSVMGQSIYKALSQSEWATDIDIYFLNSLQDPAAFRFSSNFHSQTNIIGPLAKEASYISFIDNFVIENKIDIIYPGTQHELFKLSQYRQTRDIVACPLETTVNLTINKYMTAKLLHSSGVPVARTIRIEGGGIDKYPSQYPVVVKPNKSSASRNVHICNSLNELNTVLDLIKHKNVSSAVCQEYLKGEEYTCGIYLDKYSNLETQIILKRELAGDGSSLSGTTVKSREISNYLTKVIASFTAEKAFDYGHINVQLRCTDDGPKLFEINGRLSSTETIKATFGFNSVEAYFYNIVLHKEYDKFNPNLNASFIRYYDEIYF